MGPAYVAQYYEVNQKSKKVRFYIIVYRYIDKGQVTLMFKPWVAKVSFIGALLW